MSCRDCDGLGFLFVEPGYVDRLRPAVPEDHPDYVAVQAARASLALTVYPCPGCRPEQFTAWSGGHYNVRPLGASSPSATPKPRRGREQEPLPIEPSDLEPPNEWALRRDLA